ncbi:MAG: HEPN domain-containing protein [Candidatus Delongbacteria bacterium]
MDIKEQIKYWTEISEYDLSTADVMLKNKKYLYVGFMCHQTIEKILKAYFVNTVKEIPPYIHNLTKLTKLSGLNQDLSEDQKEVLDVLEPLNIEARYPTYKNEIFKSLNETKCKQILSDTKELYLWIKNRL